MTKFIVVDVVVCTQLPIWWKLVICQLEQLIVTHVKLP